MARVLVVDDDSDFVKMASRVLEQAGYTVACASDGTQALKLMRKNVPDVVLLDIMTCYILDGLDINREMAEDPLLRDIPVIMLTPPTAIEGSEMFSTDEYIPVSQWVSKPIDPQTLLVRVSAILA